MHCPDCAVKIGQIHKPNCDVERCPSCGFQALQCLHGEENNLICENTGLKVKQKDLLPWTGEWPGKAEAREYGFWCKMGRSGWESCSKDDPEAREDLNMIYIKCVWDREQKKYILKKT